MPEKYQQQQRIGKREPKKSNLKQKYHKSFIKNI